MARLFSFFIIFLLMSGLVAAQLEDVTVEVTQVSGFQLALLSISADSPVANPGQKVTLTVGIPLDLKSGQSVGKATIFVYRGSQTFSTIDITNEVKQAIGNQGGPLGVNLQLKVQFTAPTSTGDYMVTYKVFDQNVFPIITESQGFTVGVNSFECPADGCGNWQTVGNTEIGTGTWQSRSCSTFSGDSSTQQVCSQQTRQEYRTVCTAPESKTIEGAFVQCDDPKTTEEDVDVVTAPTGGTIQEEPPLVSKEDFINIGIIALVTVGIALVAAPLGIPIWVGAVVGFIVGILAVTLI